MEYFINIIVEKEYGHYFLEHLSKPVLSRNDRAKLSRGEKKLVMPKLLNKDWKVTKLVGHHSIHRVGDPVHSTTTISKWTASR